MSQTFGVLDAYDTAPPATDGVASITGGTALNAYVAAGDDVIAIVRATGPLGARVTATDAPLVPPGATTCNRTA